MYLLNVRQLHWHQSSRHIYLYSHFICIEIPILFRCRAGNHGILPGHWEYIFNAASRNGVKMKTNNILIIYIYKWVMHWFLFIVFAFCLSFAMPFLIWINQSWWIYLNPSIRIHAVLHHNVVETDMKEAFRPRLTLSIENNDWRLK